MRPIEYLTQAKCWLDAVRKHINEFKVETDRFYASSGNDIKSGAGDEIRTRDFLLGKETCCHCTTPA